MHLRIEKRLYALESFEGCIQYLKINQKVINTSFPSNDILNGVNIEECEDRHCFNNNCSLNGRCRLTSKFKNEIRSECICNQDYNGEFCEIKINPCFNVTCHKSSCVRTSDGKHECICLKRLKAPCDSSKYLFYSDYILKT